MPSFDIVSRVNEQEVDNAINQAIKEMETRYDFKGSKSELKWEKKQEIIVIGDDEHKLKAVTEILRTRLAKRGVSLKALEYGKVEEASGGLKRQTIKVRQGVPQDKAREIARFIKELKLKVQPQIQGDQIRVSGNKTDDLQTVIRSLKEKTMDIDLQFVNMRS